MIASRFYILFMLSSVSIKLFSQFSPDSTKTDYSLFIGGKIGYSTQTDKTDVENDVLFEFHRWEFSPRIGLKISENTELGLSLEYSASKGNNDSSSKSLGINLFSRYYIYNRSNFSMNLVASIGYTNYNNIIDNRPFQELTDTEIDLFSTQLGVEAQYNLTSRIRVRSSLFRLSSNWYKTTRSTSITTRGNIFSTETIFEINSIVIEFLF